MTLNHATQIDKLRKEISLTLDSKKKIELGQFMTPSPLANFMASLFSPPAKKEIHLLDAGAGIGSLSVAFIERYRRERSLEKIKVSAYEIDDFLFEHLNRNLAFLKTRNGSCAIESSTHLCDFIESAVDCIQFKLATFTHVILNPPYKKISSKSRHRKLLRAVEVETVNLYAAFLALSILLTETNGEIVAIIPRSFCNGPYYRPFRKLLLGLTSIDQIHIFESRKKLFRDDDVLQENVILRLTKSKQNRKVKISHSSDSTFSDYQEKLVSYDKIVVSNNNEIFIHIPTHSLYKERLVDSGKFCNLEELGISVSTGPVVDFRLKQFLLHQPKDGSTPLIYPIHYGNYRLTWPKLNGKKPNAIKTDPDILKWLYPNGYYTVVKRFSSKEEAKRIKAYIHEPRLLKCEAVGFENHLNIYHNNKTGLEEEVAFGLMAYLNSKIVDTMFRQFNGHTQVNATDLRMLKYPKIDVLREMGTWVKSQKNLTDEQIDEYVGNLL